MSHRNHTATRQAAATALLGAMPARKQTTIVQLMWLMVRRDRRSATELRPFRRFAPKACAAAIK